MGRRLEPLESRWVRAGGFHMHYRVSAAPAPRPRVPVVLVHGLAVSSRYLVPTARRLASERDVYLPDLPGYGQSEKPGWALNLPELVDALVAWMEAVGLGRAAFLGNSFGCQIIAELAARHPGLVARAVLVGPTVDPKHRSGPQQVVRWLMNGPWERPSLFPILVFDTLQAGIPRVVRTFRYMMQDRIEEKLPRMEAPTMVVYGSRDPLIPDRWAEEATRLLPDGRCRVIPGAPHDVNYSASLELARVTRPFLREGEGTIRMR